jgi:hypothetical protein
MLKTSTFFVSDRFSFKTSSFFFRVYWLCTLACFISELTVETMNLFRYFIGFLGGWVNLSQGATQHRSLPLTKFEPWTREFDHCTCYTAQPFWSAALLLKSVDTFAFLLKSDNNSGHFTWRPTCVSVPRLRWLPWLLWLLWLKVRLWRGSRCCASVSPCTTRPNFSPFMTGIFFLAYFHTEQNLRVQTLSIST